MASIDWPLTLPKRFNNQGVTYGVKPMTAVSNPLIGPARIRGRSTAVIPMVSGTIRLVSDDPLGNQVAIFKQFFTVTLKGGALRFNWVDPTDPPSGYDERTFQASSYDKEVLIVNSDTSRLFTLFAGRTGPIVLDVGLTIEIYDRV